MNFIKRLFGLPRGLYRWEVEEIQNMVKVVQTERYKLIHMKKNTLMFKGKGKELVEIQEAMVDILENAKNDHIRNLFGRLGYPNGMNLTLNLATGRVNKTSAK